MWPPRPAVRHACTVITTICWALWSQNEIPVYLDSWHFSGHPFLHLFLADNYIWPSVFSASHCMLVVVIFQLQRANPQWWLILVKIPCSSNVLSTSIGNKMLMLSLHWVTCYCTWVTVSCCISKLQYNYNLEYCITVLQCVTVFQSKMCLSLLCCRQTMRWAVYSIGSILCPSLFWVLSSCST